MRQSFKKMDPAEEGVDSRTAGSLDRLLAGLEMSYVLKESSLIPRLRALSCEQWRATERPSNAASYMSSLLVDYAVAPEYSDFISRIAEQVFDAPLNVSNAVNSKTFSRDCDTSRSYLHTLIASLGAERAPLSPAAADASALQENATGGIEPGTKLKGTSSQNPHVSSASADEPIGFTTALSMIPEKEKRRLDDLHGRPLNPKERKASKKDDGISEFIQALLDDGVLTEPRPPAAEGGAAEKQYLTLDDVAGLQDVKRALKEAIMLPLKMPNLFRRGRPLYRGIFVHGTPGGGKTFVVKCIASEVNIAFISVSASHIMSKWQGTSEKMVRAAFELAKMYAPSILMLDEIDGLCGVRSEDETESSRRVKNEFIVQMDGIAEFNSHVDAQAEDTASTKTPAKDAVDSAAGGESGGGSNIPGSPGRRRFVILLAATNLPFQVDPAVRRRFDRRIFVPLPDFDARLQLFKSGLPEYLPSTVCAECARLTEGFSGSDVTNILKSVSYIPLRKLQDAQYFYKSSTGGWAILENGEKFYASLACAESAQEGEPHGNTGDADACLPELLLTQSITDTDKERLSGNVRKLLLQNTRHCSLLELEDGNVDEPRVTEADVLDIVRRTRTSVSRQDIEDHERFANVFGS